MVDGEYRQISRGRKGRLFTIPVAYLETRSAPIRVIPDSGSIRKEKYTYPHF